ncbi:type II secretion system secretin GspD [bacterium]|nr:type II secretion system secretin GspD [bacterium]
MKKFVTFLVMLSLAMPLLCADSVMARPKRNHAKNPHHVAKTAKAPKAAKEPQITKVTKAPPPVADPGETNNEPIAPLMDRSVAQALRNGHILLNFENIDVRVLARMMSELTGKNIVVDSTVNGKATILSSREVTVPEAWEIFKAAMSRYGFSVVNRGGATMIVPTAASKGSAQVLQGQSPIPSSEDTVMAVLILKRGNPEDIEKTVKPLLSETGVVSSYKDGKAIVITDQANIVNRVAQIVKGLDSADPKTRTTVIFPRYMEAEKVVNSIKTIYKEKESRNEFAIAAFAPSNAVIVSASPDIMGEIKQILYRLDIPLSAPTKTEPARFFVYNLQFAQATDVAKILSEMLSERQKAVEQRLKEAKVPATENAAKNSNAPKDVTADITGPTGKKDSVSTVGFTSSKVSADTETNSLLLYVSPSEYDELRSVIAKLDCERRQIQISAVVAEVSLQRAKDMGVNWQAAAMGGVIGSFSGGLTEEGLLNVLASGNFVVGTMGSGTETIKVNNQDVEVPKFLAFLSMLANNTDYNLISAPRVLTQDNKQATINVGQVVPFATSGKLDAYGQPLVTFDYRNVGIKLEVTPHMSRTGKIRMDVKQEIQEVTSYLEQEMAGVKFSAPVVSNREVTTTVTIPDGDTLLIGGLIAKKTSDTIKGVPFLRDLPLIGFLFRSKSSEEQKVSIFISLTPKVVDLDDHVENDDAPLVPYLKSPGLPGDQQHENRDTILPDYNGVEMPVSSYQYRTTQILPRQEQYAEDPPSAAAPEAETPTPSRVNLPVVYTKK